MANQAEAWGLLRTDVTWTNHQPASSLVQWYRGSRRNDAPIRPLPPVPAVGGGTQMVCYELPIYAAYYSGVLDVQALWTLVHGFDRVGGGSAEAIMKALTSKWSFRWTFDPACTTEKMTRGDIVFFNGVGHVAIALGNTAVSGQIASVWGMNPIGMAPNTPIEVTTVNAVLGQIAPGFPGGHAPAQVVTYSSPSW